MSGAVVSFAILAFSSVLFAETAERVRVPSPENVDVVLPQGDSRRMRLVEFGRFPVAVLDAVSGRRYNGAVYVRQLENSPFGPLPLFAIPVGAVIGTIAGAMLNAVGVALGAPNLETYFAHGMQAVGAIGGPYFLGRWVSELERVHLAYRGQRWWAVARTLWWYSLGSIARQLRELAREWTPSEEVHLLLTLRPNELSFEAMVNGEVLSLPDAITTMRLAREASLAEPASEALLCAWRVTGVQASELLR